MPISAGTQPLKMGIESAWNFGKMATVDNSTQMFMANLASVVPMGLYPTGITLTPLVPAGVSASISTMIAGLSMGKTATIKNSSMQMAQAISLMAPMCPPAGLTALAQLIEASMSMGKCAKVSTVAQQIAQAIVLYYTTGGTV